MVTLGLGELVAACFLMFPGFFGGEAGVTLQRTRVPSMLGLDYGRGAAQLLLTAAWTAAVLLGVHWLSRTPFGLATLAVRENAQRIEYLGFRTATVRWVSMAVASTLAGVAGALSALAYEIVTVDAVSLHLSANVLLMTVIGGLGSLWGPLVGALFLTVMQSVVSDWTRAWLFYYGFVFVVLVWLAPEGITGLWQAARRQRPAPRTRGAGAAVRAAAGGLHRDRVPGGAGRAHAAARLEAPGPGRPAGPAVGIGPGGGRAAGARAAPHRRRRGRCMNALELQGLHKRFGLTEVIRGTDLAVRDGERLALIGPNGAGKSTLFALVSGQLVPDAGCIRLFGQDLAGQPPHTAARAGLGRSFQVSNLFGALSVADNLRIAAMWSQGQRLSLWTALRRHAPLQQQVVACWTCWSWATAPTRWRASSAMPSSACWRSASRWPAVHAACCWTSPPRA
jgi:branched-chain amino acid transport system ATP-binding protein